MLKEKQSSGTYLGIIGGKFRQAVPQGTPGAILRTYETRDGKTGEKWEKEYESLTGRVSGVNFYDGEFGKNITVFFKDGEEDYGLTLGVATPYAEDLMKKLPAVILDKTLTITPYDFEDDKGKRRRGITIYQDGKKIESFFFDREKKEIINGAPKPEGDTDMFDSEDWKMYYTKLRKFTINYITEKIVPKLGKVEKTSAEKVYEALPGEDIDPDKIPF